MTEAAIGKKTDSLHGLKENVIMGNLIPAGTGLKRYSSIIVDPPEDDLFDAKPLKTEADLFAEEVLVYPDLPQISPTVDTRSFPEIKINGLSGIADSLTED